MKVKALVAALVMAVSVILGAKSPIEKAKDSVVMVSTSNEVGRGLCSGFVAPKKSYVITAAHCVLAKIEVDGIDATPLSVDTGLDLAVLKVTTNKQSLSFRSKPVVVDEPLIGLGHAFGWDTIVAKHVKVLVPLQSPVPVMHPGIIVDPDYIHGMSGGPVVDEHGDVVGVVQAGNSNTGYGVNAETIKAFLYDAGVR